MLLSVPSVASALAVAASNIVEGAVKQQSFWTFFATSTEFSIGSSVVESEHKKNTVGVVLNSDSASSEWKASFDWCWLVVHFVVVA